MNKKRLVKLRNKLFLTKAYFQRTSGYINLINSTMILYLFLSQLKSSGYVDFEIKKYIIPIIILGVAIFIFIGFIEIKVFKGWSEEMKIAFGLNPQYKDMKNKIDKIYEKMELKEKL